MKTLRFVFFLTLTLSLAGCALPRTDIAAIPDERAGPNLIIYFAEDGNTRRAARAIAEKTGGELFDLNGKKPPPNLLDYNTFFVGASLEDGRIAAPLEEFLARTDFMDGRVVPFWISRDTGRPVDAGPSDAGPADVHPGDDLNGEFERIIQGARFLPGGGFRFAKRVKAKDVEEEAETWAEAVLRELGLRRAAGGDRAEDMVKLFAEAYRGRFGPAVFQDGDWTLEMDGTRWYYAQGRFLPQEEAGRPENFRPQFLYRYPAEPPVHADEASPWQDTANRVLSRRDPSGLSGWYRQIVNPGAVRSPFFDALWQSRNRTESYEHQKWIDFLGRQVQIHEDIVAPLGRVEARIQELAKDNGEIPDWLNKLASITGWNWRNVAGSASRSFHAYGAAVDLLMKAQPGMETYWQWTEAKGIDWRTVPAEKRQNPPAAVIRAFEDQGFIWGGRWSRYDTMHFEYHPELLIFGTGNARQRV
ncbi:MAG: M15 family metallopeptidase [Spirochaetaceae bacterium]|nr:M15 family metallopeptidase [Spirochaetaceae bacterium]